MLPKTSLGKVIVLGVYPVRRTLFSCRMCTLRAENRTSSVMKLTADRSYADPQAAAPKLIEIANINAPMVFDHKAAGAVQRWPEAGHRARLAHDRPVGAPS